MDSQTRHSAGQALSRFARRISLSVDPSSQSELENVVQMNGSRSPLSHPIRDIVVMLLDVVVVIVVSDVVELNELDVEVVPEDVVVDDVLLRVVDDSVVTEVLVVDVVLLVELVVDVVDDVSLQVPHRTLHRTRAQSCTSSFVHKSFVRPSQILKSVWPLHVATHLATLLNLPSSLHSPG